MAQSEKMSSPTRSLAQTSAVIFISMSTAGALALLTSIIVARRLGASDFGLYSIVTSVQAVVFLLGSFSLGTATAKYVAEYRVRNEEQALRFAKSGLVIVLILASSVSIVYVALSGMVGRGLYKEPAIVQIIPLSALVVISSALFALSAGIVQGCQKFRLMAAIQIASPLLALILIFLLLPFMGIEGIFIGYFLSQMAVSAVALMILNRREFRFFSAQIEFHRESVIVSKLLSFALPAGMGGLMIASVVWIANTELTLDGGFETMGYFAVAYIVYVALMQIPNAIAVTVMPRVSELTVRNHADIEKLMGTSLRTLSITLFPVMFAVALFSELIVKILYGQKFSASANAVYFMATASYFYTLSAVIGSFLTGMGRMWLWLELNGLWAAVFLAFVFVGVPVLGLNGLALSYAAAYCVSLVLIIMVAKRIVHISVRGMRLAAVSSVFFFLIGYFTGGTSSISGLAVKLGLFLVGASYFCLIGWDVVSSIYPKVLRFLRLGRLKRTV
jgi:PST family polysaccharide transporter